MDYMLFQNDEYITSIVAKEDFVKAYCQEKGYTYKRVSNVPDPEPEPEPEPTEVEQLRAQVADLQNQILTMRLGG